MPYTLYSELYIVSWCDPASGGSVQKSQSGLSRAAVVTIGQDDAERIFILEAFIRRIPPDQLIEKIFQVNRKWRSNRFGIDASGPQKTFAELLAKEARDRQIKLPLRPTALHADKTFTIETTIQPVIANGRLFRPPEAECVVLKEEFIQFPSGDKRDGMDALACAIRLLPKSMPKWQRELTREQYRRYLMSTGMDREAVEARLVEHADLAVVQR